MLVLLYTFIFTLSTLPGVPGLSICPTSMVMTEMQEILRYTSYFMHDGNLNDDLGS